MRSRWSAPRPVTQHGSLTGRRVPDIRVWRGPRAAAVPAGFLGRALPQLRGTVEDHILDSAALGTSRQVTIYRPPGPAGPLPGCVLADGNRPAASLGVWSPRSWPCRPARPASRRAQRPGSGPGPGPTCVPRNICPATIAGASTRILVSSPARLFGGRGGGSARSKGPGSLRVSPAARASCPALPIL